MIRAYANYAAKKSAGARAILPAGGYVAKIMTAKVKQNTWGDTLEVAFDIAEGECQGFFKHDYDSNTRDDRKWRGVMRLQVPSDQDDPKKDSWKKNVFENFTCCVQESNPGYEWDWDESGLKGKMIGVLFNNREWEMNGNTGWTTECRHAASVDDIRNGKFKVPKDRPLKKSAGTSSNAFTEIEDSDDEVPF